MATPFHVGPYMPYTTLISRAGKEPTIGVLLQGPYYPVVLSVIHAFEPARIGDVHTATLFRPDEVISLRVQYINQQHDFIIFEVVTRIDRDTAPADTRFSSTPMGEPYVMLGYSSCERVIPGYGWRMTWTATPGYLTTDVLELFVIGTGSGSSPDDSGGPLFSRVTNKVIGINIAASTLHVGWTDVQCARAQVSCQGNLKPLWAIELILGGGCTYFQPGGVPAYYAAPPNHFVRTSTHQPSQPVYAVRREQQLFTSLADLFSEDLLDPYR